MVLSSEEQQVRVCVCVIVYAAAISCDNACIPPVKICDNMQQITRDNVQQITLDVHSITYDNMRQHACNNVYSHQQ